MTTRASRLKSARKAEGLRQSDVASRMNRSISTIKKWEMDNGASPASLDDIAKLCKILNISIDYYINGRQHRSRFTLEDLRMIDLFHKILPENRPTLRQAIKLIIDIQNRDKPQDKE